MLDLYKLLLILAICFHHCHWFKGIFTAGYMSVEFFFIISGYFIYLGYKRKQLPVNEFFTSKCLRLFPTYILVLIAYICLNFFLTPIPSNWPLSIINEGFMLQATGLFYLGSDYVARLNSPAWYLSALLWSGTLLYLILRYFKHAPIIIATIIIATYVYLFGINGGIENWGFTGPFYIPFWRGMAGLGLGILLGFILDTKQLQQFHPQKSTAIQWIVLMSSTGIVVVCMFLPVNTDFVGLICLFVIAATLLRMPLSTQPRWLQLVPDISFEILLIHSLMIGMTNSISRAIGWDDILWFKSIVMISLTITGALMLQRIIMPFLSKTILSLRYAITSNLRNNARL